MEKCGPSGGYPESSHKSTNAQKAQKELDGKYKSESGAQASEPRANGGGTGASGVAFDDQCGPALDPCRNG